MRFAKLPSLRLSSVALSLTLLLSLTASHAGAEGPPPPNLEALTIDAAGTVHASGVTVDVSSLLSPEGKAALNAKLHEPRINFDGVTVAQLRAMTDRSQTEILARWRKVYRLNIAPEVIGGVQTDVVRPADGVAPENHNRVLINLHGGGFFAGARFGGQAESAPLAGLGRITVITVDYRMAPENTFPAASEDVEKVYAELLKTHAPSAIGIYGCSAGGALTAQAAAWFQSRHLPPPGAIGIFCSGALPGFWYGGDSQAMNAALNAVEPRPPSAGAPIPFRPYLAGADMRSPLVTPGLYPDVLAKFPPTLIVTGTRDVAMSNAIVTNLKLQAAGAQTQLLVLEGFGHGQFNEFVGAPETDEAYRLIWRFFDSHLSR